MYYTLYLSGSFCEGRGSGAPVHQGGRGEGGAGRGGGGPDPGAAAAGAVQGLPLGQQQHLHPAAQEAGRHLDPERRRPVLHVLGHLHPGPTQQGLPGRGQGAAQVHHGVGIQHSPGIMCSKYLIDDDDKTSCRGRDSRKAPRTRV